MTLDEVLAEVRKNNGGTYVKPFTESDGWTNALGNDVSGYYVGRSGGVENLPKLRKVVVTDFVDYKTPDRVGFWYDKETDTWSIDSVWWSFTLSSALAHAVLWNQKAVWDIAKNEEFRV